MNIIQLNKFSELHDGQKVIFCKTDFIYEEFDYIKSLDNEVILITGNSDYPINDKLINDVPLNVKIWFGQNILGHHPKINPIPMGIENKNESVRKGHGVGYYDRVSIKEKLLSKDVIKIPIKEIYSNFNINTNFKHRNMVKQKSIELPFIDWEYPTKSLEEFFDKILDYKIVLCPAGNGIDTHRIWEILYSNRVPLTIKIGNYKIYELYEKLPIIILDSIEDLENFFLIQEKYEIAKTKFNNLYLLDFEYWKNKILENLNND